MSFDLLLIHLENGEPAPADRRAVLDVIRRYTAAPGDAYGYYDVPFDDGSHVQISAGGLETDDEDFSHCAFHLRSFAHPILRFVYEIAVAGDMMIVNPQGGGDSAASIIVAEDQRQHLWDDAEEAKLVTSAAELGQALGAAASAWQAYRDQVVGGPAGS